MVTEVLGSIWCGLKYEGFVIWPFLSQIIKYLVKPMPLYNAGSLD